MSDTTTVAAEPNEKPAGAHPVSPLRRALVWAAVVGVIAAGTTGLAATDLVSAPVQGGAAARFVPADGTAFLVTAGDGTRSVHENARDTGPALLLELPAVAGAHFFEEYTTEQMRAAQLWRETVTALDSDDPQTSTVYQLDGRGISMLTSLGGAVGFSYSPGIVMLPADAAPGATWSGEGTALPTGGILYRSTGTVASAADGCLLATTDTRYLDTAGTELLTIVEQATWCPGRGMVLDEGDVSGTAVSFTSEPLPDAVAARDGLVTETTAPGWADASGWRARDLGFQISDPVYGDSPQGMPFDGLAASTEDGTLVASMGSRLAAYTFDGTTGTRVWQASPGGDLLAVAAVGEVTLVSTAERRLLAYDGRGARLWAMSFPDVVLASPAAAGDGDIVAVSVDGTVRRIDLASGETVWSVALRTDVAASPAVVGDVVAVVDRGGVVLARSLADGSERWSLELPTAERVAGGRDAVVVQGSTADVWVLDAADGTERWTAQHNGVGRSVAVIGSSVVSQSDEETVAWPLAGGDRLWQAGLGEAMLPGDGRVVIVGVDTVQLRDADGTLLGEVGIGSVSLGVTRVSLPTEHGIRILQSNTTGVEVR